jgi:hypothetical protein
MDAQVAHLELDSDSLSGSGSLIDLNAPRVLQLEREDTLLLPG